MCRRANWTLWVGAVLLLLGAGTAQARKHLRVTPGIDVRQEFNSNINYRERDPESDVVTVVTPTLEFSYEGERGYAKAQVGLRSRSYWRNSELNAVDRFGQLDLERLLSPRLAVMASGRLAFYPNRDAVEDGSGQELIGDRPDYFRQDFSGGFRYALDPLSTLTVAAGFHNVDYDQGDSNNTFSQRDLNTIETSAVYVRQVSERDEAGLSLRLSRDHFDEVRTSFSCTGEETNQTVSAVLHWAREWTRVWSSRVAAGARSVRLEDDGIPGLVLLSSSGLDLSPTDTSFGFVGNLEVTRRTKRTVTTLGYSKQTTPSSGYGSTVGADTVSVGFTARLTDRLGLDVGGFAQQYESLGDTLGVVRFPYNPTPGRPCGPLELGALNSQLVCVGLTDDAIDATVLGAHFQLGWRVNGHWRTFLRYTFRDQTSEGERPLSEYTNHRVMLGFRYAIPIDLF